MGGVLPVVFLYVFEPAHWVTLKTKTDIPPLLEFRPSPGHPGSHPEPPASHQRV